MSHLRNISRLLIRVVLTLMSALTLVSCFDEQHPGTYYISSGQSVADFLEEDPAGRFEKFIYVLKKSQVWGELDTYGTFTCFAPINEAFDSYLQNKGLESIEDLSKADCDTIAWNHLIRKVFYMSDQVAGALPHVNLLNRFLTVDYVLVKNDDSIQIAVPTINRDTRIIHKDDSVENGVVQVVDNVIKVSGDFVYDIVKNNPNTSIFAAAMNLVALEDTLKKWHDHSYTIDYDSAYVGIKREGGGSTYTIFYVPERNYGFTMLVEPDSVYRSHGINSLDDLIAYADSVYHKSYKTEYESYGGKYDTAWSDQRNPLRRFVEYHILPFSIPSIYSFNCREDILKAKCRTEYLDAEDYFETSLPHSVIRVSRIMETDGPYNGVYINRRGLGAKGEGELGQPFVRGIKVNKVDDNNEYEGCNGYMHYIDDILTYSDFVREDVLNRRMRVDCCTLSPDFLTSGARQKQTADSYQGVGFKQPKNFVSYNSDNVMWVRSAFVANISYQGDGLDLQGNYDIMLKLPPIPYDGNWELRLSYRGSAGCGVVQNYVGDDPTNLKPCGIPTDLRLSAEANPNIRWKKDDTFKNSDGELDQAAIDAYDKAMRNRGYMKGPDSHYTSDRAELFRDYNLIARRIITTDYFYANRDYYLRMKLVSDNPKAEMNFDYMEWCPKSVYDNNEDKH